MRIWRVPDGQPDIRVAASELLMKSLERRTDRGLLDSLQWQGKSGAFGYQDGHPWLKTDFRNWLPYVVGLPLDLLREMLSPHGVLGL